LLQESCEHIQQSGRNAIYYCVDVSDLTEVKSCIQTIISQYQRIDLLFNNASTGALGTTEIADQAIQDIINTNLNGADRGANHELK
jgi:NAD(P)-dependent dehydrogenase (short-subunit alcohol dehydrogenase family)